MKVKVTKEEFYRAGQFYAISPTAYIELEAEPVEEKCLCDGNITCAYHERAGYKPEDVERAKALIRIGKELEEKPQIEKLKEPLIRQSRFDYEIVAKINELVKAVNKLNGYDA